MLSDSSNIGKAMNVAMNSNVKPANAQKSEKPDQNNKKNIENAMQSVKSQGKAKKKSSSMNEVDYDEDDVQNDSELFDLEEVDEEVKAEEEKDSEALDHDVMDLLNKKYPNNKHVGELKDKLKEYFDNGYHFEDLVEDVQFQIKVMFSEKEHDDFDGGFEA
ncbi:MAG: hypothetical protein HRT47_00820 [Candidatus Caenarcaniphilales bacterium]|nr:hypothetical protein [Candidatus Caenarcaniphilales bacterium]